ncbi:hypothetical protein BH11PSE3_BH11PSE3_14300 [soil metagenome]
MNDPLDSMIARASRAATHPRLKDIDSSLVVRIAHGRQARARTWRMDVLACAGALAIGLGGALTMTTPTTAATVASLSEVSRLAPSTLLDLHR